MKKVGFIGLGVMGKPMASHLVRGGIDVTVADLNQKVVDELVALGASQGDYQKIAKECDIILMILPKGAIVQDILFGNGNMIADLREGQIVVDHSSVTPIESRTCADKLAEAGVKFMDAPVSGGEEGAIAGKLAVMCGGSQEVYDELTPYFNNYAATLELMGDVGAGSTVKLCNQIICNINIATVAEGLVFAAKAGVDPKHVFEAIRGGFAGSAVMDSKAMRMCLHDFTPSATIEVIRKDLKNALDTGHMIDCPLPMSAAFFEVLQSLKANGHLKDDTTSIVTYFEQLADIDISKFEA